MVLNIIWISFFFLGFIIALMRLIMTGDTQVFPELMQALFTSAKNGFEISLGLTGVLTLWLGIMRVGEHGGIVNILSRLFGPFFCRIFPGIPKGHPAYGSIIMNFASNMMGLDNAATPLGLKAMKEMQEINPDKEKASDPMITFLVLNTAGMTLIPINVMVYRAQLGATDPSDVFLPILLATFFALTAGILSISLMQKINLFNRIILSYAGGFALLVSGIIYLLISRPQSEIQTYSATASSIILFSIITGFIILAIRKKADVYSQFIEGAKEGFTIAIKIIPYLVAMLAGIAVFRASGAMDYLIQLIASGFAATGIDTGFVPALPVALMKPFSGSGARALMIETMTTYGADSFAGRIASVVQSTTDTTFYIIALYFGSVGIKKIRYAIWCGLIADAAGIIAAILLGYLFFH